MVEYNQMEQAKIRGNPAWHKGMISANPQGRPKGRNTLTVLNNDIELFLIRHRRWERLCWNLIEPPYTWTSAARRAGYSPKSARFIASRLKRKDVVRAILFKQREMINNTRSLGDGEYLIPDYSGKYHIYRNK